MFGSSTLFLFVCLFFFFFLLHLHTLGFNKSSNLRTVERENHPHSPEIRFDQRLRIAEVTVSGHDHDPWGDKSGGFDVPTKGLRDSSEIWKFRSLMRLTITPKRVKEHQL